MKNSSKNMKLAVFMGSIFIAFIIGVISASGIGPNLSPEIEYPELEDSFRNSVAKIENDIGLTEIEKEEAWQFYISNTETAAIIAVQESSGICLNKRSADTNRDENVNLQDLLQVLSDWEICPNCRGDVFPISNNDGLVGVEDLLLVLANWGTTC